MGKGEGGENLREKKGRIREGNKGRIRKGRRGELEREEGEN